MRVIADAGDPEGGAISKGLPTSLPLCLREWRTLCTADLESG
jgi:hypothetical protein